MIGTVVHHGKYGYGVVCRSDKFNRLAAKFESGKEVGGFSEFEIRPVEKEEFESKHILDTFKAVGIDQFIKMDANSFIAKVEVESLQTHLNAFESLWKISSQLAKEGAAPQAIVSASMNVLQESKGDNFTKNKALKRISRMESSERLLTYLQNSLMRLRKIDEDRSILKLNIALTEVIENISEKLR